MPRTKEAFDAIRQTTRQKIEAAALSLFARKGLSVKIGEIAEEAGISQGLMYSHYPSKDALIIELVRQATAISSQSITDVTESDGKAVGKVNLISNMICQMFADAPVGIDYFIFMLQVGMSDFKVPEASWYSSELPDPVANLARVITKGQEEGSVVQGDPLQLSIVYWAVIQGLCCYAVTGVPSLPEPKMLNRILLKEEFL